MLESIHAMQRNRTVFRGYRWGDTEFLEVLVGATVIILFGMILVWLQQ